MSSAQTHMKHYKTNLDRYIADHVDPEKSENEGVLLKFASYANSIKSLMTRFDSANHDVATDAVKILQNMCKDVQDMVSTNASLLRFMAVNLYVSGSSSPF